MQRHELGMPRSFQTQASPSGLDISFVGSTTKEKARFTSAHSSQFTSLARYTYSFQDNLQFPTNPLQRHFANVALSAPKPLVVVYCLQDDTPTYKPGT